MVDNETLNLAIAICKSLFKAKQPLVYGGTVGTGGTIEWSKLPIPSAENTGATYVVISSHSTDPICDEGDMIVSNGTSWTVVPAGSDIDDTTTAQGKTWSSSKINNELSNKADDTDIPRDYSNITVATTDWSLESTPTYADFPYKADITIIGATANDIPEIIPSEAVANDGLLCQLANASSDKVTIYASAIPSNNYTLLRVTLRKENVQV